MEQPQRELPLEDTNAMQMELIQASGMDAAEWIDANAGHFRNMVEADPELVMLYRIDAKAVLAFISDNLADRQSIDTIHAVERLRRQLRQAA